MDIMDIIKRWGILCPPTTVEGIPIKKQKTKHDPIRSTVGSKGNQHHPLGAGFRPPTVWRILQMGST